MLASVLIPHVVGVIACKHCLPRTIDRQLRIGEKSRGFCAKGPAMVGDHNVVYRHFVLIFLAANGQLVRFKLQNKKTRLSVLK